MNLYTLKQSFRRVLAVLTVMTAGVAGAAGYDLEFINGVAVPGGGTCTLNLGDRCRFSDVVIGAGTGPTNPSQRDVIVTVTKLTSSTLGIFDNAAPTLVTPPTPVATPTQFFSPSVQPTQTTANVTGWAEFTFDLLTPGGAAPAVGAGTATLPGSIWTTSFDTDGNTGTLREFVEFLGVPAFDTALSAGTTLSGSTAVDGGVQYQSGSAQVNGISTDPIYKASAVLTNPASFKLVYGARTGASGSTDGPRLTAFDFLRPDAVLLRPLIDGYKSVKLTTDADGNGLITPGDTLTYTVTYANTGNAAETGFQITDPLPTGATITAAGAQTVRLNGTLTAGARNAAYTGVGANTGLLAAGQILPVGGTVSVDIPVTVNAVAADNTTLSNQTGSSGNYTNAAGTSVAAAAVSSDSIDSTTVFPPSVVASTGFGTVPAGSVAQTQVATTDPTTVNVRRLPQLTLSKSIAAPGRVDGADQFTVQIKNGATLTASASTSGTGTAVSTAATTLASGTAFTLTEIMAAGSVSPLTSYNTVIACTNSTAGSATVLPSGAGQSFALTPVLGDVISCTLTNTARQNDLAVNKAGPAVVTKGAAATYTVKVWNIGPDSVIGTTIADTVPGNLTGATWTCAASGSATCGTASGSGNTISFTSGLLPVNASATPPTSGSYLTLTVTGTATTAGSITNTATVTSPASSLDTVSANNASSQATIINNPPVTADVTNALLLDTAAATVLSPNLSAADSDGTVASYTIVTIPNAASGVLSVNGAPITAGNTGFTAAQLATLSFAPKAGFAGNATFTYTATDNQGAVSNISTYTIPVNAAPVAVNDSSSTPANTAKTFSITGNDTDVAPGIINVASTVLAASGQPAGAVLSNANRTITVPGEGSYTLDNLGNVTFTPVSGYSGTTTAVKYTVTDNQGAVSNVANITVTVTPVAVNDAASTAPSTPVNIPVLTNDIGTGKALTSLLFPAAGQPAGSVLSGGGKTLTNADGVYAIRTDGTVDFTPALGRTGALSPVLYTFVDASGQTSNPASITVMVSAITPPVATNDTATTPKATAVTLAGSTNDTAKTLAIDNASVILTAGGTITNAGKTLTNAEGVYQVQPGGTVIFTPAATFAGTATPVSYTVKDTAGNVSNAATLSVTVTNQPPVANNVTNALLTSTAAATALSPGISGSDPDGSVVSYTITTLPTAAQGTLYCSGTAIASVPGTCAPGNLTFKPNPAFNGNASFQYTVTDDNGAVSNVATYTIPVNKPPVAVNDSAATNPNVSVTFSVTGNDTDTGPGTVDAATAVFDTSSTGTISNAGKTLTVPGEGTYTLDNLGSVTFVPVAGFNNGASTARYTVKDNNGAVSNVATITVTVPASVDLAITKNGPAYFKPGDTLPYTLTVTNSGSAATGVTVTDTLPTGLTFVSASSGGTYNAGTGKVSWTVGNVANGATVTLTVTGTAPNAVSVETNNGPTSLLNTASAAANEAEVVTANNTASSTAQLVYPRLTKRVRNVTQSGTFGTVGTGKPGEVLEYCIDFRNYGVAVAGFVLSDTVPANTNANLSAYGAGLGLQVTRGTVTTRTSTGSDADGGTLSASALSADLGSLTAGESGGVCFQSSIK